jgi:hypothetical protein
MSVQKATTGAYTLRYEAFIEKHIPLVLRFVTGVRHAPSKCHTILHHHYQQTRQALLFQRIELHMPLFGNRDLGPEA